MTEADGLAHKMVRAIHETADGALWFGTQDGVSRWRGNRFEPIDVVESELAGVPVIAIDQDRAGAVWMTTDR